MLYENLTSKVHSKSSYNHLFNTGCLIPGSPTEVTRFFLLLTNHFRLDIIAKRAGNGGKFRFRTLLSDNHQNTLKTLVSSLYYSMTLEKYSKFNKKNMRLHYGYPFHGWTTCRNPTTIAAKLREKKRSIRKNERSFHSAKQSYMHSYFVEVQFKRKIESSQINYSETSRKWIIVSNKYNKRTVFSAHRRKSKCCLLCFCLIWCHSGWTYSISL